MRPTRHSFNTQPPEGGWMRAGEICALKWVSTHSRPKAAGDQRCLFGDRRAVSTHSRPKAAGRLHAGRMPFDLVSTHSRPKAAGDNLCF